MVSASVFSAGPPTTQVDVLWNQDMDQTSLPPLSVWEFIDDGTPRAAIAQAWLTPANLRVDYTGSVPSTLGLINLIATDPGLRCFLGGVAKAPQSAQFFP